MNDTNQMLFGFDIMYYPSDVDSAGNTIDVSDNFDGFSQQEYCGDYKNVAVEAYCSFIGSRNFPNVVGLSKVTLQNFPHELANVMCRRTSNAVTIEDAGRGPAKFTFNPKSGAVQMFDIIDSGSGCYSVISSGKLLAQIQFEENSRFAEIKFDFENIHELFECSDIYIDGMTGEKIEILNIENQNISCPMDFIIAERGQSKKSDKPAEPNNPSLLDKLKDVHEARRLGENSVLENYEEMRDWYRREYDADDLADGVFDGQIGGSGFVDLDFDGVPDY